MSNTKVFCIGRNKTGTTSLKHALIGLGYKISPQRKFENLVREWDSDNFEPIIELVNNYDAFQDIPFSYPKTYRHMDTAFPNSKFILSIRDTADEWYDSLLRFHKGLFKCDEMPTIDDLKNSGYVWRGFMYETNRMLYNSPEDDPYNKAILTEHYNQYNKDIIEYFKDRPDDLLVLNLKDSDSYMKLCTFLGKESDRKTMPHLNKSKQYK